MKIRLSWPITFATSMLSVIFFISAVIITHKTELIEAGYGTVTIIFFLLFVVGWLGAAALNGSNKDDLDIFPCGILLVAAFVAYITSGYHPMPYVIWSWHTFFFWFIQGIISLGAVGYTLLAIRDPETWGFRLY